MLLREIADLLFRFCLARRSELTGGGWIMWGIILGVFLILCLLSLFVLTDKRWVKERNV